MLCEISFSQTINVKGIVFDKDSATPMPFAYAVDKNSSNGTVANDEGKFSLSIQFGDTLAFSYLGYNMTKIFTHTLKDSVKNFSLRLKIFLRQKTVELKPLIITSHSFTKEEKEYYERRIEEYKRMSSLFTSNSYGGGLNIDALYYALSKKGKELKKLSGLYQQLLIDEIKENRISADKIRMITGNDTLNTKDFLNFCFLPDQFILSASDYDLFLSIKRCYREYLSSRRKK
ncbi:MAG: carboxypeptidase-like regulatory domain-containing protein [Bacteroidetes bacterium]|nr:carboxypeptidase-like regulatory domain-containing protein [Bacteroidota bacterium]